MEIKPKKPDVTLEEISLVLVGDFNPRIFHPVWFAHHGLLRESEAEEAQTEIVHQDVSAFAVEWLTVQVLRDRFTARIKADPFKPHLNDLVQGVFQLLAHTPVRQLGINVVYRLRFKSEQDCHGFGHFITPKSPWKGVLSKPGLRGVHVQSVREMNSPGFLVASIEPDLVPGKQSDALMRINDHYELPKILRDEREESAGASWAVELLRENFDVSIGFSQEIVDRLIANFLAIDSVDDGN